jgi:hypothetical protein
MFIRKGNTVQHASFLIALEVMAKRGWKPATKAQYIKYARTVEREAA